MSLHIANPEHEVVYQELVALVSKHAAQLTPLEILAVAANMIGKLLAMQDQRTTTPRIAMEVIRKNIEHGNAEVIRQLAEAQSDRA